MDALTITVLHVMLDNVNSKRGIQVKKFGKTAKRGNGQKRGPKPSEAGPSPPYTVRIPDVLKDRIDVWSGKHPDKPGFGTAIKMLVERGFMPCMSGITPEMIKAGEEAVLTVVGGADLGGFFDPREFAASVYRAMVCAKRKL